MSAPEPAPIAAPARAPPALPPETAEPIRAPAPAPKAPPASAFVCCGVSHPDTQAAITSAAERARNRVTPRRLPSVSSQRPPNRSFSTLLAENEAVEDALRIHNPIIWARLQSTTMAIGSAPPAGKVLVSLDRLCLRPLCLAGQSAGRPPLRSGGKSGLHTDTAPDNVRRGRPQGKRHRKQTAFFAGRKAAAWNGKGERVR
jgi:hypothetical protein